MRCRASGCVSGSPVTAARTGTPKWSRCSNRRNTGSRRCARSPVWTGRAGAIWRSPTRAPPEVGEGDLHAEQRVGERSWQVPVTAFWQAHRDAARVYSELVAGWAQPADGMTAWDLYGGAGVFAAVLADAVGPRGRVLTVDT